MKPVLTRLRVLFEDIVVVGSWQQALGMEFQGFRGTYGSFQVLFARSDVGLTLWFILGERGWLLRIGVRKLMEDGQIAEKVWQRDVESPVAFFMQTGYGSLLRAELNRVLDSFRS